MGKALNPRLNPRSRGGRPKATGDRYPSGKLRPAGPNARALDIRKAFGVDSLKQRFVPLDIAHRNGWLDDIDYLTGIRFANLHQAAGFGQSGAAMGSTLEVDAGMETSLCVSLEAKSYFSGLPHAELADLWDRVFDRQDRKDEQINEASAKAMLDWKAANAAMTPQERAEVTDVCVLDSFPQWILQRAAGHEGTVWECKRDLLIKGLAAVRKAIRKPGPVVEAESAKEAARPTGPLRTERTLYVDEEGTPLLEVERRTRRPEAA